MKRFIFLLILVILIGILTAGCKDTDVLKETNENVHEDTEKLNENNEDIDNGIEIDRSEYLTGEIITDGRYGILAGGGFSTFMFIPDSESSEIMKGRYTGKRDYILAYDNLDKVKGLPKELGIYKVKVKVEKVDDYGYLFIDEIELTDNIGTVLYEGKVFETNDLDDTVNAKDIVSGLIVERVIRSGSGLIVDFAGEIECEGYYIVDPKDNDMFGPTGDIYVDKEYKRNFPVIYGEGNKFSVWFSKTNSLFDELANHSLVGRGKFKIAGYRLIYNIGMGTAPWEAITEIVSLDKGYESMFESEEKLYLELRCTDSDFAIIASTKYDKNYEVISTDYYYINRNNPVKIYLFSGDRYAYTVEEKKNEFEFTIKTDGFNMSTGNTEAGHSYVCKISEQGTAEATKLKNTFNSSEYGSLFELSGDETIRLIGDTKYYVIVSLDKIDESSVITYSDYYYINKSSVSKVYLFSTDKYDYGINTVINENELMLFSKRGLINDLQDSSHRMICRINDGTSVTEMADGFPIDLDRRDDNGRNYRMQGVVDELKLIGNGLYIKLKDIKMKKEDALALGLEIKTKSYADILLIDNYSGLNLPIIEAGETVALLCSITADREILYTYGHEMKIEK
ncbi:MAG TPA: hypothetical protein DEF04_12470 [Clostridiales bacterium]|nr:hypothetical protein [Clostridiales bacterium]